MDALRAAYDALGCGVLIHAGAGRVVGANEAALRMVGLSRAQLLGAEPLDPVWRAIEAGGRDLSGPTPLAALARDCPRTSLVRITVAGGGPPAWVRCHSAPAPRACPPCEAVSTLVDVGEEGARIGEALARVEGQALRRLQRLQAVRNAAMAMNASHDLRLTLNVIVQQATAHLGVSAAAIALLDEDAGVLVYSGGAGFNRSGITRTRLALGEGYLGRAGLELRPLSIPDLSAAPDFLRGKLIDGEGFVAYFAVPLAARGRLVGVLELFHRRPLEPEPEWLEFGETLADHAAMAIESARLREQLRPAGAGGGRWERPRMSRSQEAILRLLARGHSNRDIARRVYLSENTVKFHLRQIYRKLGVHSRTEAAMAATSRGWL